MPKKKEPIKQAAKKAESTPAAAPVPTPAPAPAKPVEAATKPAAPAPAPAPAKPVEAAKPAAPAPAPAKPVEAAKPAAPAPAPAKPVEAAKPAAAPAPASASVKPAESVKTTKPAVSAKAAKSAAPAKTGAPVTIIVAKHDAGYGNNLYIRGEGAGLSWETGALMKNVENDVWVWTTNETAKGAISFKFLLNDSTEHWSIGDNLSASTGETTTVIPYF